METIKIGGIVIEFLHSLEDTSASLDMFRMTVMPNARMPVPHYHENWDETVYGLSGTITFRIDGNNIAIAAGQSAFIRRRVVHGFDNRTDAPAVCLVVLTPGVLGPGYFREIAALVAGGPPDPAAMPAPARMREIMRRYGLVPVVPS